MTMVRTPRTPRPWTALARRRGWERRTWGWAVLLVGWTAPLAAQPPEVHYPQSAWATPGAIGGAQLERGGPLSCYMQPVEVKGPPGTLIAVATEQGFTEPRPAPLLVGLAVGAVYRFEVLGFRDRPEAAIYPTVELINRLYPPPGSALKFPVPIDLDEDDLRLALDGHFVTRVIYLEDPDQALPIAQASDETPWFDAGPGVDPLYTADALGRPLAILRLGTRQPRDRWSDDDGFLHGAPPVQLFELPVPGTGLPAVDQALRRDATGPSAVPPTAPLSGAAGAEARR